MGDRRRKFPSYEGMIVVDVLCCMCAGMLTGINAGDVDGVLSLEHMPTVPGVLPGQDIEGGSDCEYDLSQDGSNVSTQAYMSTNIHAHTRHIASPWPKIILQSGLKNENFSGMCKSQDAPHIQTKPCMFSALWLVLIGISALKDLRMPSILPYDVS